MYIKNLDKHLPNSWKVVQYADDMLLFCEHQKADLALKELEKIARFYLTFFRHSKQLNAEKRNLAFSSKKNIREPMKSFNYIRPKHHSKERQGE